MTESDTLTEAVEEFLGNIRIGDIPDIDRFVADYPDASAREELRGLLQTLLGMERLAQNADGAHDDLPSPDLSACGYRIVKKIGAGGMGVVYEAVQLDLDRHVAVKLLRPSLLSDPEIRSLFKLEARILALFDHPGIVRILGTGQCADSFFYVMELENGRHLDTLRQRPGERQLLQWAVETADALACAHGHGIVHGDIKPANLLLDRQNRIRLCDFGLAFVAGQPLVDSKRKNGTFRYMPPELLNGGVRSFASDQYSLCASLVEVSTGQPFDRTRDYTRLFRNRQLGAVLSKGLAAVPSARYRTASELADDLRRIVRHEPVQAVRVPFARRFCLFCRRHPLHALFAAMLVACLAAVAVGFVRTEAALTLARRNAEVANSALGKVFGKLAGFPPSPDNADLLAEIIPYYEKIIDNPNIPRSELTDALSELAQSAMHTGDNVLAERTLRRLHQLRPTSGVVCRLADTLLRQGKSDEAAKWIGRLLDDYATGRAGVGQDERLNVAWAFLRRAEIGLDPQAREDRLSALRLLSSALVCDGEDEEALYLYAQFLRASPEGSFTPIPNVSTNALEILDELSTRNPGSGRYLQAFIDAAVVWLRSTSETECPEEVEAALVKSDIALWRFRNRPSSVTSAVSLKLAYAQWLRDNGIRNDAAKAHGRATVLLSTLLNVPDLPESEQTGLVNLALEQFEESLSAYPGRRRYPMRFHMRQYQRLEELRKHLSEHSLPGKEDFIRRISRLEEMIGP